MQVVEVLEASGWYVTFKVIHEGAGKAFCSQPILYPPPSHLVCQA
jgi:hypothetical protein